MGLLAFRSAYGGDARVAGPAQCHFAKPRRVRAGQFAPLAVLEREHRRRRVALRRQYRVTAGRFVLCHCFAFARKMSVLSVRSQSLSSLPAKALFRAVRRNTRIGNHGQPRQVIQAEHPRRNLDPQPGGQMSDQTRCVHGSQHSRARAPYLVSCLTHRACLIFLASTSERWQLGCLSFQTAFA